MLRRFFSPASKGRQPQPSAAKLPDGLRVYAIGDIHGRSDLLDIMHGKIAADLEKAPAPQAVLVYLGDYIDRGPDSCGVLERLSAGAPGGISSLLLKGNHEEMLLRFLADPSIGLQWRQLGGMETILSYKVDVNAALARGGLEALAVDFRQKVPARHIELLQSLKPCAAIGDYFFCHAGVRPGVPLERQREEDLLWIREPFLQSGEDFGKVVVHGHSPVAEPELRSNRINIDTGAYATHCLTCLVLEGAGRQILQAAPAATAA